MGEEEKGKAPPPPPLLPPIATVVERDSNGMECGAKEGRRNEDRLRRRRLNRSRVSVEIEKGERRRAIIVRERATDVRTPQVSSLRSS